MAVLGCDEDVHIGVGILKHLNAFGSRDEAHENNIFSAPCLDEVDGRNRRPSGGQHGIHNENFSAVDIGRKLAIVFYWAVGVRVTVDADVAHLCVGNQGLHAFHHSEAGSEDRNDGDVFSFEHVHFCFA